MAYVYYPKYDGKVGSPIKGWTDGKQSSYHIKQGECIDIDQVVADAMVKVYPFLEIRDTDPTKEVKKAKKPKKAGKAKEKKPSGIGGVEKLDIEKMTWGEMRSELKKRDKFRSDMKKSEAIEILTGSEK